MTENKRFRRFYNYLIENETNKKYDIQDCCNLLNNLSNENEELKKDYDYLEKRFKEEEWHYDHIDEDRDAWRHKCQELEKENEQLKAQLYCDSEEGVCSICKHHYLEKGNIFYISKCEKGHEKCSKKSVRHCEDFEIKDLKE